MLKQIYIIFSMLFLGSCGLKIQNEIYQNLLTGNWKGYQIECYETRTRKNLLEKYEIGDGTSFQLEFGTNQNFNYEVKGNCTTTAYGRYNSNFDGDYEDTLSLYDVISGSTCEIDILDSGSSSVGIISVDFTLLQSRAQNNSWKRIDDTLLVELPTAFTGSSNSNTCADGCYCFGAFTNN